jgi:ABC-type glycerol-3-phosphate transport system substrate-binding protein
MNNFIDRLKADRILQIIVVSFLVGIILLFFLILKPIFFKPKQPQLPCYKQTITIWWPFDSLKSKQLISDFEKFCVQFNIIQKSISDISNDLVISLAEGDYPQVIFVDNDNLEKLEKFLATPTPVAVDSLVAYYNQDVLNFLGLSQPRTFPELKNFISKIQGYKEGFYAAGLGTKDITRRGEIILSLLKPDAGDQNLETNLSQALSIYLQFANPSSEYFSYDLNAGNDLYNFANGRLALYFGFYSDKDEILKISPRLNYSLNFSPLNNFPPDLKTYSKVYYLAPIKKGRIDVFQHFLSWLENNKLQILLEEFGFVPILKNKDSKFLIDDKNKRVILDAYNFFGETFSFVNKKVLFDNLDNLLTSQDKNELVRNIQRISNQLQKK